MRLADHSVSLKALPVNALIGLEQTTRFTGGHDCNLNTTGYARGSLLLSIKIPQKRERKSTTFG